MGAGPGFATAISLRVPCSFHSRPLAANSCTQLAEQAAACHFHLCKNHAFIDGNKRIALLTCEVFLRLNGYTLNLTNAEAEDSTLLVASGKLTKAELTTLLQPRIVRHP